jgi:hypothetical protein
MSVKDILADFVGEYDVGTWGSYRRIFIRFGVASVLSFRLAASMCATLRNVSRRGRTLGGSTRFAGSLKSWRADRVVVRHTAVIGNFPLKLLSYGINVSVDGSRSGVHVLSDGQA